MVDYLSIYRSVFFNAKRLGVRYCYKKPSSNKLKVEETILNQMSLENGIGYRILTFNQFMFTCGYKVRKDGIVYLKVFTPSKEFMYECSE